MIKIFTPFALYWHYVLDVLLTHIFVIAFLQFGHPIIASILIATDSIFKITLSIFTSRIVRRFPPWSHGRISLAFRFMLIILWMYAFKQITVAPEAISLVITPFLLFKFLMMIDSSISTEFVFLLRDYFKIDISQITATQLIFIRGSTAAAPAVALTLLLKPNMQIIVLYLSFFMIFFGAYFFRKIYFSSIKTCDSNHSLPLSLNNIIKNPLMRWGFAYQILANIAFAGVSFLLLATLQKHNSHFLNEITWLYTSFFAVQCFILIFGDDIIPIKTTAGIGYLTGITGLLVLFTSASPHSVIALIASAGVGFTYSLSLSAIQIVLTSPLQGQNYTEYAGWSQTAGRLASFMITAIFGVAMNLGYSISTLLLLCGFMGIASASILIAIQIKQSIS